MPNVQPIKSVNVAGTVHPLDSVFTVLSGISTVAGSASSSSYKSVRWYVSGIEGITEPYDGMKLAIKVPLAGVATAGAVLSINGDVDANYHPLAYNINTALTTHFPVNSIKIFTYDANQTMDCYLTAKTKVTITGVWKAESNYDSNSNSIGYQVRTNTAIYKNGASTACYRYQILVETEEGLEAFTSTSNQTGTSKTQLSPKYIPNGTIRYYSTTTTIASGANFGATALWQQYQGIDLRYSFNIATITTNSPCYIKMSRNDDGTLSPVYSATSGGHPLVFALPTTKDGYYYTYLGRTYTSSSVVYLELELDHPTFYYDNEGINVYNGKESEYALEINLNEFTNRQRDFTDAEIATLKNSAKPIKIDGVSGEIDYESVSGFAILYKNINDMWVDIEAVGHGSFDLLTYSTVIIVGAMLAKFGIQINCNTKVGTIAYCEITTNTRFNNDLPSILDTRQYYVPSEIGDEGQFLISTGNGSNPFTYRDVKTLDTTATSAQSTNDSEALIGSGKITLHKVSKTGNYNDLLNKPTIPTNTNQKVKAKNNGTDVTFGDNAVVEIKAGTNVQVAANATDNTITISSTDTNTTYTVASGDSNGQIKVTPSSGDAYNVNVKGLGSAAYKSTGTASGNVPVLDNNGKLAESVIPAVAITDTYEADSQTAMLALTAQKGDICIRSDLNKSFVLQTAPASTLANWKELKTPTDAVLSVNGQTGAVTLDAADVGAATSTHKHSYTPAGSVSLGSNDTASGGVAYIASVSGTAASGTPTTKYLHKTTANASPNAHTHTVTVSGTTGANGGTKVTAVTGIGANGTADVNYNAIKDVSLSASTTSTDGPVYVSGVSGGSAISPTTKYMKFNAGTTPKSGATPVYTSTATGNNSASETVNKSNHTHAVTLTANEETATGRIIYLQDVTHTAASLTGTKTFTTNGVKAVSLTASETSTDGPQYIQDVTHTAASLTGTKTFNTDAIKAVSLSASSTSTDGPQYIQDVTHTAATLTGTTTFITAAIKSASTSATRTTSGSGASARRTLTLSTSTSAADSTGTVGISGGSISKTTKYMKVGTTAASTGTVGISGGSISKTTRYMKVGTTASDTGTVGISGGSISKTTRYLSAGTSASTSTVDVAKNTHTHNYDKTTSVTLTDGTAPSMNFNTGTNTDTPYISAVSGGSEVTVTTRYMKIETTDADTKTVLTGVKATSTADAAPAGHTHSYGSSTALATSANSGSAVAAITGLTVNEEQTTGDIKYLEDYVVSGGTVSGTTKYFHPSFSGTARDTGEPK